MNKWNELKEKQRYLKIYLRNYSQTLRILKIWQDYVTIEQAMRYRSFAKTITKITNFEEEIKFLIKELKYEKK